MIKLKSETLKQYYGEIPNEYELKFINYNIVITNESIEEYLNLEEDIDACINETNNKFNIYFSDINNLIKVKNNTTILDKYNKNIYLRIRNKEEYEEYKKLNLDINLVIELDDLNLVEPDIDQVVIQINHLSELPLKDLEVLERKYNIESIILGQICYIKNDLLYLLDIMSNMYGINVSNQLELEKNNKITHDLYTIDEYKKIYNMLQSKITEYKSDDIITTLKNIYYYFANTIYYDNSGVENTEINNQSLINPLFNNRAVCEGYSKLMDQVCSLIGIECICVSGGGFINNGGHIWNQVKINDDWYNLDITYQSYAIHSGEVGDMFLVSDNKLNYKNLSPFAHECIKSYNQTSKKV